MARSQKPVTIKLNQDQINVLDKVVEFGEFNGRSHAVRMLLLPALNAGVTAMNKGSLRAMVTWVQEIDGLMSWSFTSTSDDYMAEVLPVESVQVGVNFSAETTVQA